MKIDEKTLKSIFNEIEDRFGSHRKALINMQGQVLKEYKGQGKLMEIFVSGSIWKEFVYYTMKQVREINKEEKNKLTFDDLIS